jgi:putative FmdB family regulatory protein
VVATELLGGATDGDEPCPQRTRTVVVRVWRQLTDVRAQSLSRVRAICQGHRALTAHGRRTDGARGSAASSRDAVEVVVMATYEYRCAEDGVFEVVAPMGGAGRHVRCPSCDGDGRRVFSAPMLALADRRLVAAIDRTERSGDRPDVVTQLPPSTRRPRVAPSNPALRRLPRPGG